MMVLTCISLMTNYIEHIFIFLLDMWVLSFMSCLFKSFVHFSIECVPFLIHL